MGRKDWTTLANDTRELIEERKAYLFEKISFVDSKNESKNNNNMEKFKIHAKNIDHKEAIVRRLEHLGYKKAASYGAFDNMNVIVVIGYIINDYLPDSLAISKEVLDIRTLDDLYDMDIIKRVSLNNGYVAEIHKGYVTVGCSAFPNANIIELHSKLKY